MFLKASRIFLGILCFAATALILVSIPSSLSSTSINQYLIDSNIDKLIYGSALFSMAGLYFTWGIGLIKRLTADQVFFPTMGFLSVFISFLGYAASGCPW